MYSMGGWPCLSGCAHTRDGSSVSERELLCAMHLRWLLIRLCDMFRRVDAMTQMQGFNSCALSMAMPKLKYLRDDDDERVLYVSLVICTKYKVRICVMSKVSQETLLSFSHLHIWWAQTSIMSKSRMLHMQNSYAKCAEQKTHENNTK